MGMFIQVTICMGNQMAMESIYGQMEIFIKAIFLMVLGTGGVYGNKPLKKTREMNMKVNIKMTKNVEKELINGKMEISFRENF